MAVPSLRLLGIKLLRTLVYRFCVNIHLHFPGLSVREGNCWVVLQLHILFLKTVKLFSQVAVPFYKPTSCV
jgi:hypothetical protein